MPDELAPEDDPDEHDDDETELSDVDREALGAAMAAIAAQGEMIRQLTGQFTKQLNAIQAYTAPIAELGRVAQNPLVASGAHEVMKAFRAALPVFEFPELRALQSQMAQLVAGVDWSGIQQAYRPTGVTSAGT